MGRSDGEACSSLVWQVSDWRGTVWNGGNRVAWCDRQLRTRDTDKGMVAVGLNVAGNGSKKPGRKRGSGPSGTICCNLQVLLRLLIEQAWPW